LFVTVTPNPAWDVTYEVPVLVPGEVHRVHRRLGGKGVNVARVLAGLGHQAVAVLPGPEGLAAEAGLAPPAGHASAGAAWPRLIGDVVPGLTAIRQTLVVQGADGATTSLWEPGIEPAPGTEHALTARVLAWLSPDGAQPPPADTTGKPGRPSGTVGIVLSGSLPPGLDPRVHARLATAALEAGVRAVVDTSGEALAHAADVPGVVLAPNAAELAQLTGSPCDSPAEAIAQARNLLSDGLVAIVVTLGKSGLAAVTKNGTWHGRLPEPLPGNPTGAGDAAAAALIAGLATESAMPVVVHLDHAVSRDLVTEAVELGIPSVMFDASALDYADNVAATADVSRWCHERGAWVETELGEVGGKDGVHAPGARTDPAQAAAYVAGTGVDALAVAVGSSHAMLTRDARLDNALIAAIADVTGVPLVLHGSSGVPDEGLVEAVRHGMVKINIATQLNKVLTAAVRAALAADQKGVDPRRWMGPARSAVSAEVEMLLALLKEVKPK
jgi:fructose-bisphosphate aldolase, class II